MGPGEVAYVPLLHDVMRRRMHIYVLFSSQSSFTNTANRGTSEERENWHKTLF